jgi:hypothetical protein
MALYLAQLASNSTDRIAYHDKIRAAYNLRSQIAHGSKSKVDTNDWAEAWALLMDCFRAVVRRNGLPAEKELLAELLQGEAKANISD